MGSSASPLVAHDLAAALATRAAAGVA